MNDFAALAKLGAGGALVVIACYLVWVLSGGIATAAQVTVLDGRVVAHQASMEKMGEAREQQMDELIRLNRIMCGQLARTDAVRVACNGGR